MNDDREFIEMFYRDFEQGMANIGKKYVRPADYIERAMRILTGIRNRCLFTHEGHTRSTPHENN